MAVSLLTVGEHLSLEFDPSDLDAVKSYVRERFPDVATKSFAFLSSVRFGGTDFTFQNEWDSPCLISDSARGDELLREIHAHLS